MDNNEQLEKINKDENTSSKKKDIFDYRNSKYVEKLNMDIKKYFENLITPIQLDYHITFNGISRLVMLDRYSQKDKDLISLSINDLVLTILKHDQHFPIVGIGIIVALNGEEALIQLEEQYISSVNKEEIIKERIIKRNKRFIDKPLEIYFEQIAARVAKSISSVELNKESKEKFRLEFYNEIKNLKFVPAGRILYGAGSDSKVTFFNCFVLPYIEDTRQGIARHREMIMEIMSRGGGVGTNGSTLRPRRAIAKEVGGHSSGAVSWLNDLARLTHLIQQGGSRRGAQMIMLADWHPDVIEFIISKMQNPHIVKYLIEKGKDEKIKNKAKERVKFKKLDSKTRIAYESLLNNEKAKEKLSDSELHFIEELLNNDGEYIVKNLEYLSGTNISIAISDRFMEAIKKDEMWDFCFPNLESYSKEEKEYYDKHWHKCGNVFEWKEKHKMGLKIYSSIKARFLWDLINFCATYSAEPGLFFIDRANAYTNANAYDQKVVATNPCGEQPLPPFAVCNLGAINLSKFICHTTKEVLWNDLEKTIRIAVRFQDNVTDKTPYFLNMNKTMALSERRIGLGVMGLHDLLIWKNLVYGNEESLEFVDNLFKFIAETAYDESSNLSFEKEEFPYLKNNRKKFVETLYCSQLSSKLKSKILAQGIRNSHLLTIAPTGTTGTMIGVSTGLEPYFAFSYYRSGRLGDFIKVESSIVNEFRKENNMNKDDPLPKWFITANQLTPNQHVMIQTTIQKWIDSSISKTVNAPKGFSVKQVEKVYETLYEFNAKGGTVYVDGSRTTQVLTLSNEEDENKQKSFDDLIGSNMLVNKENEIEEDKTLRANRLDKPIGVEIGNICPLCLEGTIVVSNGCNICTNCQAQLVCGT